jgi:hypothetical protein
MDVSWSEASGNERNRPQRRPRDDIKKDRKDKADKKVAHPIITKQASNTMLR